MSNITTVHYTPLPVGLQTAITLWADATTDATSQRRHDLQRDKCNAVTEFFAFAGKAPALVRPTDVKAWQTLLESQSLAPSTIYAKISKVSSFYRWAMSAPELADRIPVNPVDHARPKAPKPYQTEKAQALSDHDLKRLLAAVPRTTLTGKRDFALLLFYTLSGHRREEVIRLRWKDLERNGALTVRFFNKGGDFQTEEVSLACWDALIDYLQAAARLEDIQPDDPLWVGHDRAGQASGPLSSHAFAGNLKRYARKAGIGDVNVHQLRHTYARMVAEDSGSLTAVQEALGHRNLATTRVYVRRIAVKPDRHSAAIMKRLQLGDEE